MVSAQTKRAASLHVTKTDVVGNNGRRDYCSGGMIGREKNKTTTPPVVQQPQSSKSIQQRQQQEQSTEQLAQAADANDFYAPLYTRATRLYWSAPRLIRVPRNAGIISPASLSTCPRRLKPAVVTAYYDPQRARPELESLLRGRPKVKLSGGVPSLEPTHQGFEVQALECPDGDDDQEEEAGGIERTKQASKEYDDDEEEEKKCDHVERGRCAAAPADVEVSTTSGLDATCATDQSVMLSSLTMDIASRLEEADTHLDLSQDTLTLNECPSCHPNNPKNEESLVMDDDDDDKKSTAQSKQLEPPPPQQQQESPEPLSTPQPEHSWTRDPPPLCLDSWTEQPAEDFNVRCPTYLRDGIKQPSELSVFEVFAVDLVKVDQPLWETGMCRHPNERIQRALGRERQQRPSSQSAPELPAFVFVVNFLLPASRGELGFYHWATYFGTNDTTVLTNTTTPLGRLAHPFFFGSAALHEYRRRIFKLIPRVAEGNFVVRSAVGSRPTILGQKMKQHFFLDDEPTDKDENHNDTNPSKPSCRRPRRRYMEVLIDISSNAVANRVVKLVLGYAKTLAIDLMFLLEGGSRDHSELQELLALDQQQKENENQEQNKQKNNDGEQRPREGGESFAMDASSTLPERILGGVRIKHIDFVQAHRPITSGTTPMD